MHVVQARVATKEDVATLAELCRTYQDELAGERGGALYVSREAFGEPLEELFDSIVGNDQWLVLLGTFEDVPVGLSAARFDAMPASSPIVTVEAMYVDPAAREVGVGEELLDSVVEWASDRGAAGMDVKVLPGMRASKNFLEGAGFVARMLVMHKKLRT